MVILRTRNKITDFFMILAWASPFKSQLLGMKFVFKHQDLRMFGLKLNKLR